MTLERSWTTDINIQGRREPLGGSDLGLLWFIAVPLWIGAGAIATALGIGAYQSVFGHNQETFEAGWGVGSVFDARMAALKQLWLQFDQSIQLKCPGFVKKDGGKWWRQWKTDLNEFGAFYRKTGTHRGYGWSSSVPPAAEIGGAVARLQSLIAWGQAVEKTCPGTFPDLGILAPTPAEMAAAKQAEEDAKNKPNFFSNFGSNLGVTLGIGAVGLIAFFWLAGKAQTGFKGFEGGHPRLRRRRHARSR
jgi:hypothetical protein